MYATCWCEFVVLEEDPVILIALLDHTSTL